MCASRYFSSQFNGTSVSDAPRTPPSRGVSGGRKEDPGHARVTKSLGWPEKALGCSQKSWRKCPGRGKSQCPCSDSCPHDLASDKAE